MTERVGAVYPGKTYQFRIRAYNENGYSPWTYSDVMAFSTTLTASGENMDVLTANDNFADGDVTYVWQVGHYNEEGEFVVDDTLEGDGNTYTLTGDETGVIRVIATDSTGQEAIDDIALLGGVTLTGDVDHIDDETGYLVTEAGVELTATVDGEFEEGTFKYVWIIDGEEVEGGSTYTTTEDDVDKTISVKVVGDGENTAGAKTAEDTYQVAVYEYTINITAEAKTFTSTDDFDSFRTVTYVWEVGTWEDGEFVAEATLTPSATDPTVYVNKGESTGKTVRVTATDEKGHTAVDTIEVLGSVTLSGDYDHVDSETHEFVAEYGVTLTATLNRDYPEGTYKYIWTITDDGIEVIEGNATYTTTADDIGKSINIIVVGDGYETAGSVVSKQTYQIVDSIQFTVTINSQDNTYTADHDFGDRELTYTWEIVSVDEDGNEVVTPIDPSETDPSEYINNGEADGKTIRVTVTDDKGHTATDTIDVLGGVTLTGDYDHIDSDTGYFVSEVGVELTASVIGDYAEGTYSYVWVVDGVDTDATGATYVTTSEDIGKTITVKAVGDGTNVGGVKTAAETYSIIDVLQFNVTLTSDGDTYTADDDFGDRDVTYTWEIVSVDPETGEEIVTPIPTGEDPTQYVNNGEADGKTIRVTVTDDKGHTATDSIDVLGGVTLTGDYDHIDSDTGYFVSEVGVELTASVIGDYAEGTYSYVWVVDGEDTDATGSTYVTTNDDVGKTITVKAVGDGTNVGGVKTAAETYSIIDVLQFNVTLSSDGDTYTADDDFGDRDVTYTWEIVSVDPETGEEIVTPITPGDDPTEYINNGEADGKTIRVTVTDDKGHTATDTIDVLGGVTLSGDYVRVDAQTGYYISEAGTELTASVVGSYAEGTYSYIWIVDGVETDVTGDTYVTTDSDLRKTITVKAIGDGTNVGGVKTADETYKIREVASLHVTITDDTVDEFDGKISLRETLIYAEAHSDRLGSEVTFDSELNGQTIALKDGELEVTQTLTFNGANQNITVSGKDPESGEASRIFYIKAPNVEFDGLTLAEGSADYGGAVYVMYDNVGTTFNDCVFTSNTASSHGGAVYSYGAGEMTFNACVFTDNIATHTGGAYSGEGGPLTFVNSVFSGNSTTLGRGAIFVTATPYVTLQHVTVVANAGGGIYLETSVVEIFNSIIYGNTAGSAANLGSDTSRITASNNLTYTANDSWWADSYSTLVNENVIEMADNDSLSSVLDPATFELVAGSTAINAGDPDLTPDVTTDLNGKKRDANPDLGALEYYGVQLTGDYDHIDSETGNFVSEVGTELTANLFGVYEDGAYNFVWVVDGEEVDGGATYVTTADDIGKTITVKIVSDEEGVKEAAETYSIIDVLQFNVTLTSDGDTYTADDDFDGRDVTYTWEVVTVDEDGNEVVTPITPGDDPTEYINNGEADGKTIRVTVTDDKGHTATDTIDVLGGVTLTGDYDHIDSDTGYFVSEVGVTLTASVTGDYADGTYSYVWVVSGEEVAGDATYVTTSDDIGKTITVKAVGDGTNVGGVKTAEETYSIIDTLVFSVTLTPDGNTYIADDDFGDRDVTYKWEVGTLDANGNFVVQYTVKPSADDPTQYVNTGVADGKTIRVTVTDDKGHSATDTIDVLGGVTLSGDYVRIDGETGYYISEIDTTLTASVIGDYAEGTYTYVWVVDGVDSDATGATYVTTTEDIGKTITVKAVGDGTNVGGVKNAAQTYSIETLQFHVTITSDGNTYTANHDFGERELTYTWEISAYDEETGDEIFIPLDPSVDNPAQYINNGDADGCTLRVTVTDEKGHCASDTIYVLGDVTLTGDYERVDSDTGYFISEEGTTLTATVDGTYDDGTINYIWIVDGQELSGGATYTTANADVGKTITVKVVGDGVNVGGFKTVAETHKIKEAPSLVVTITDDKIDEFDGKISLREAILYAGLFPERLGYEITFASNLNNQKITLRDGELVVRQTLTINGADQNITVSGDNKSRIFNLTVAYDYYYYNDLAVTISGLTLTEGFDDVGGAVYVERVYDLTFNDCSFTANTATTSGGAVACYESRGTFNNCSFTNNKADGSDYTDYYYDGSGCGGAVHVGSCAFPEFKDCVFTSNVATNYGGALFVCEDVADEANGVSLINAVISDNSACYGGGIYSDNGDDHSDSTVLLRHVTIVDNTATESGGGICCDNGSFWTIYNSILYGNTATVDGQNVRARAYKHEHYTERTSVTAYNTLSYRADDGWSIDEYAGEYNYDPIEMADNDSLASVLDLVTFYPVAGSTAINAGNFLLTPYVGTDVYGNIRDLAPDLGAVEYDSSDDLETPSLCVTIVDDIVDATDGEISLREAILYATRYPQLGKEITFAPTLNNQTITLVKGELQVNTDLIVNGADQNITVSGNNASGIFHVNVADELDEFFNYDDERTIDVTFVGLTFANGGMSSYGSGGAVDLYHSTATFNDCVFTDNSVRSYGGAVYSSESSVTFTNTVFSGNSAQGLGGAIYLRGGALTLQHVTIVDNSANFGGGIYLWLNATMDVYNSIIYGNTVANAYAQGSNVHANKSTITASNNLTYSADDAWYTVNCTVINEHSIEMTDNDSLSSVLNATTYELVAGSAAINAGDPNLTPDVTTDLNGVDRDSLPDLGALEYIAPPEGNITANGNTFTAEDNLGDDGYKTYKWEIVTIDANGNEVVTTVTPSDDNPAVYVNNGEADGKTIRVTVEDGNGNSVTDTIAVLGAVTLTGNYDRVDADTGYYVSEAGNILTANVDGEYAAGTLSYVWVVDGQEVAGGATYTTTVDDIGKTITVKVSGDGESVVGSKSAAETYKIKENPSLNVTIATDVVDEFDGKISLREAILYAENYVERLGNEVTFASNLNNQTITVTNGELVIERSMYIVANADQNITLSGNNASRIFKVATPSLVDSGEDQVIVEFGNLTFANGAGENGGAVFVTDDATARFFECDFTSNSASYHGGAVALSNGANAEFLDCDFTDNEAGIGGGAIVVTGANGNGSELLFYPGSESFARFEGCEFLRNHTVEGGGTVGGAVLVYEQGAADFDRCLFQDNYAPDYLVVNEFDGDYTSDSSGGAIFFGSGASVRLFNSVFSGNYSGTGGAISSSGSYPVADSHTGLVMKQTTVVDNSSRHGGGGIELNGVYANIYNSIIYNNTSGGSDSADNVFISGAEVDANCILTYAANKGWYIGSDGDNVVTIGNLVMMEDNYSLASVLNPTTFELVSGSKAIDAGDSHVVDEYTSYDYNRNGRDFRSPDLGALEYQPTSGAVLDDVFAELDDDLDIDWDF